MYILNTSIILEAICLANWRIWLQLVTEKKKFASFSLEDMLFLAKDMSTAASGNQVKEARRCHGTSSSHSNPKQCQVGPTLYFLI